MRTLSIPLAMASVVASVLSISPVSADLVAHYRLDEAAGATMAANAVAGAPAGSITGTVTPGGTGLIGNAYDFGGSAGNRVEVLQTAPGYFGDIPAFTLSSWVNFTNGGSVTAAGFTDATTNANTYVQLGQRGDTDQSRSIVRNGSGLNANGPVTNDGQWHHLAASYSFGPGGLTTTLYVDGVQQETTTLAGFTDATLFDRFQIGTGQRTAGFIDAFDGLLDDVGVFDTVINQSDASLINGLGQTGGLGLDEFEAAQAVAAGGVGDQGMIGSFLFQVVDDQIGTFGDFGGTTSGGDALIFFGDNLALQQQSLVIPEPKSIYLWLSIVLSVACAGVWRCQRVRFPATCTGSTCKA